MPMTSQDHHPDCQHSWGKAAGNTGNWIRQDKAKGKATTTRYPFRVCRSICICRKNYWNTENTVSRKWNKRIWKIVHREWKGKRRQILWSIQEESNRKRDREGYIPKPKNKCSRKADITILKALGGHQRGGHNINWKTPQRLWRLSLDSREAVESLNLGIFKSYLEITLGNWL